MNSGGETSNTSRILQVTGHTLAFFITGYPILVILFVWIYNPKYMNTLLLPDSQSQPFGWFMTLAILISLFLTYAGVMVVCKGIVGLFQPQAIKWKIIRIVEIIGLAIAIYGFKSIALMVALIGPSMLILFRSPVGRMFFGF
jgi:hypothetical protein